MIRFLSKTWVYSIWVKLMRTRPSVIHKIVDKILNTKKFPWQSWERRIKLPAMGRVDGWMLQGPRSWGVSLWPHQSGQTRQGPDSVTGAGWLVRWGAPGGIYSPTASTTTASGRGIINSPETTRLVLRYLWKPLTISQRTAADLRDD